VVAAPGGQTLLTDLRQSVIILSTPGFAEPCAKALTFSPERYTAHLALAEQLSAPDLGRRNVILSNAKDPDCGQAQNPPTRERDPSYYSG